MDVHAVCRHCQTICLRILQALVESERYCGAAFSFRFAHAFAQDAFSLSAFVGQTVFGNHFPTRTHIERASLLVHRQARGGWNQAFFRVANGSREFFASEEHAPAFSAAVLHFCAFRHNQFDLFAVDASKG